MNRFKIRSQEQIQVIKRLGVSYVFMYPAQSDVDPLPINWNKDEAVEESEDQGLVDEETRKLWQEKQQRIEKLKAYRRRMVQCEKEFERSLARMRAVMNKIRSRPKDAVDEAGQLVDDIVEQLMSDESVTLHLMNGKRELEDVYYHSLNVAVIAMMVAKAKNYTSAQIKEIAFGCLFHDMGKMKVPAAIVRKSTALTAPEENYLKQHVKYGLDIAATIDDFPETARIITAQHHEMMDGSGFPDGLKGDQIDDYAQIVAVANAFDGLCHNQVLAKQKIPYAALSHLYKNCKHLYNVENLSILVKFMGVFPPGSVVQLSNQMTGLVVSVNSKNLLNPNVMIYDPTVPRTEAPIVDLESKGLKIVNVVLPSKLPEEVKEYLNPRSRISYFFDSDD